MAEWLDNRSKGLLPQQPSSFPRRGELARSIALICFVAVAGMALAFLGSYLAMHEATDGYDTRSVIGAIGLGVLFCASGIWLIAAAERMTRSLLGMIRQGR